MSQKIGAVFVHTCMFCCLGLLHYYYCCLGYHRQPCLYGYCVCRGTVVAIIPLPL